MRRQMRKKKGGELVSEVEVRSCWADAGGVMGGRNDGGSGRECSRRPAGIIRGQEMGETGEGEGLNVRITQMERS